MVENLISAKLQKFKSHAKVAVTEKSSHWDGPFKEFAIHATVHA